MSTTYNTILRQLAMTANALAGATPAALQTTYETVPLTSANFDSSVFSFGFLKDKLINSESGLIYAIASTAGQPLRSAIMSQTAALAYGARIVSNAAGLPVIGEYGAVRDSSNGEPLALNELEGIRDRHLNAGSMFKLAVYEYAIVDKRIYATRPDVVVDVCAYERPDSDGLDLSADMLLPDVLGPAVVQGAIAECFRDDRYIPQAQAAGSFYSAWVAAIKQGLTNVQPQANPTPDAQRAYAS